MFAVRRKGQEYKMQSKTPQEITDSENICQRKDLAAAQASPPDPLPAGFKSFMQREQQEKIDRYHILNKIAVKGGILFTGSSLMEQFPILELMMNAGIHKIAYNRAVGGFTTDNMLRNMDAQIFGTEPSRIFINIGTNDIANAAVTFRQALNHTLQNYAEILRQIKERLPETDVYLMAYYPVNDTDKVPDEVWAKNMFVNRNNQNIPIANTAVEKLAAEFGYHYINANAGLTDERGMLKKEFTVEGIHMYANGYQVVFENLKKYLLIEV